MNKHLSNLTAEMLEMASEEFSNHGCNDYVLENTQENREFYEKMMKHSCGEVVTVDPSKEKIYAQDQMIMSYLSNLLKEEATNG
jgi:uncharacterized protein YutD